jgi:hypothetical protein
VYRRVVEPHGSTESGVGTTTAHRGGDHEEVPMSNASKSSRPGKRLEIRKDVLRKLGREELERIHGNIHIDGYWCGWTCKRTVSEAFED